MSKLIPILGVFMMVVALLVGGSQVYQAVTGKSFSTGLNANAWALEAKLAASDSDPPFSYFLLHNRDESFLLFLFHHLLDAEQISHHSFAFGWGDSAFRLPKPP